MVCLRHMSIDTLHKVDTEDDDDNNNNNNAIDNLKIYSWFPYQLNSGVCSQKDSTVGYVGLKRRSWISTKKQNFTY